MTQCQYLMKCHICCMLLLYAHELEPGQMLVYSSSSSSISHFPMSLLRRTRPVGRWRSGNLPTHHPTPQSPALRVTLGDDCWLSCSVALSILKLSIPDYHKQPTCCFVTYRVTISHRASGALYPYQIQNAVSDDYDMLANQLCNIGITTLTAKTQ